MDYRDLKNGSIFWFKGKKDLIDILIKKTNFIGSLKILNVGVGVGDDLSVISKFGDVYAIDIDHNALSLVPKELVKEKKLCDVCSLPYENNFFDLVIAFDVLEHVEDDVLAVSEIKRVLKKNGKFIITVPAFNFLYSKHDEKLGHFRRYNKKRLQSLMGGFSCQMIGFWIFILFFPAFLIRYLQKANINLIKDESTVFIKFNFLNIFFEKILRIENWFIKKGVSFPFGLTIYGIFKKDGE